MTFIDDDGHVKVYYRLLPILNPNFCLFNYRFDRNKQLLYNFKSSKSMYKKWFGNFISYKNVSTNLTDEYTDEQIIEQLSLSKEWLKNNGLSHEDFVYSQSCCNLKIRKFAKKYYKYAFGDMRVNDLGYLDHSRIKKNSLWYLD